MANPIQIRTSDNSLLCPKCGFEYTHVDLVHIGAREEDQPVNNITVDAVTGQTITQNQTPAPVGPDAGDGRRHRIALVGQCENGCDFALVFTQHKGSTFVEVADPVIPVPER